MRYFFHAEYAELWEACRSISLRFCDFCGFCVRLFIVFCNEISIEYDDDEARQRQDEAQIDRSNAEKPVAVDDAGLQGWQHRTAQNGHNQPGGTEFGIVASVGQCNAINGREH